ncbi:MAG: leucine-rich repeat protein [Muribaculaceae bacterium]|nr:leucine-rich repeat protein [Muribaculaceae bacterium]
MKKFISTLLFISISLFANAYDFMVNGLCYNINSDGTSVTVARQNSSSPSYSNLSGDLVIPENVTYNGIIFSVTSIGASALSSCTGLTSVTIPNSVTSIGQAAFICCSSLTSVTIPNHVTLIGENAFNGCIGLTSVTWNAKICNNFTSEFGPFNNLKNIQSFTFGNEVEIIPACLCYRLTGLTSVFIPNLVTSIGNSSFSGCTGLTSVTIPNNVTEIGNSAFYGCSSLTSVNIPNSVSSVGNSAFYGCTSLNIAIIGENVTSIGEKAFKDCSLMENLVALRERPIFINSNVFEGVPKASCDLHVRQGSKIRYENQEVWKDFVIIVEDAEDWGDVSGGGSGSGIYGDVNGDGVVTAADVTAVYDVLLGNY